MGCQQSKIKPQASTCPFERPVDHSPSVTIAEATGSKMTPQRAPVDDSHFATTSKRRAQVVTFVEARETSPDAVRPREEVPNAVQEDTLTIMEEPVANSHAELGVTYSRRSVSSSLDSVEPDIFQIAHASSFEAMYRRWNRKQRIIAEREAVKHDAITAFSSAVSACDTAASEYEYTFLNTCEEPEDADAISSERPQEHDSAIIDTLSSQLLYEDAASPDLIYMQPVVDDETRWIIIDDVAAPQPFSLDASPIRGTASSIAASPFRARSANQCTSPTGTITPVQSKGCALQPSFVSPTFFDENAFVLNQTPLKATPGTKMLLSPASSCTPGSSKKVRNVSRKGGNKSISIHDVNGPVAPRWDKGSRALMQTQVYQEMAMALQSLMSSGSFTLNL